MKKELPYAAIIRPLMEEEGSGYLAEFPDLPGCYGDGETPELALKEAENAMVSWIKTSKEFGDPIPLPKQDFSGQWSMQVPKSLHAELAYRAQYEGVSLNTLVATILAEYIGQNLREAKRPPTS